MTATYDPQDPSGNPPPHGRLYTSSGLPRIGNLGELILPYSRFLDSMNYTEIQRALNEDNPALEGLVLGLLETLFENGDFEIRSVMAGVALAYHALHAAGEINARVALNADDNGAGALGSLEEVIDALQRRLPSGESWRYTVPLRRFQERYEDAVRAASHALPRSPEREDDDQDVDPGVIKNVQGLYNVLMDRVTLGTDSWTRCIEYLEGVLHRKREKKKSGIPIPHGKPLNHATFFEVGEIPPTDVQVGADWNHDLE